MVAGKSAAGMCLPTLLYHHSDLSMISVTEPPIRPTRDTELIVIF